jgi:hypothetical protein
MQEPIKSGDLCEVIGGAFNELAGPNIGKLVTVRSFRGEHPLYGRIFRCEGEGLITEYGAFGSIADFAQSWLRKLPPDTKVNSSQNEKKLENV